MSKTQFCSKISNFGVTVKNGRRGNPLYGLADVEGIYVRFTNGRYETDDADLLDLIRKHPAYGRDFVEVKEDVEKEDQYKHVRRPFEPNHVIMEMAHGSVGEIKRSNVQKPIADVIKETASEMAKEMVKGMMPSIVESVRTSLQAEAKAETKVEAVKEAAQPTAEPVKQEAVKQSYKKPAKHDASEEESN